MTIKINDARPKDGDVKAIYELKVGEAAEDFAKTVYYRISDSHFLLIPQSPSRTRLMHFNDVNTTFRGVVVHVSIEVNITH